MNDERVKFVCRTHFLNRMMSNLCTKDKAGALFEFDYNLIHSTVF